MLTKRERIERQAILWRALHRVLEKIDSSNNEEFFEAKEAARELAEDAEERLVTLPVAAPFSEEPHVHQFEWKLESKWAGWHEVVGLCKCGKKTVPGCSVDSPDRYHHRSSGLPCTAEENRQIVALYASVQKSRSSGPVEREKDYLELPRRTYQERLDEIESNQHEDVSKLWR